jgi:hypothetical protein
MYDPLVGRFISPDPVFQLLNQYSYTLGNPIWFWDPDGQMSAETSAAVNAGGRAMLMTLSVVAVAMSVGNPLGMTLALVLLAATIYDFFDATIGYQLDVGPRSGIMRHGSGQGGAIGGLGGSVGGAVGGVSCGIGFELIFFLPPFMWLYRRKQRSTV